MNEMKERLTFRPEAETRRKIEYWYGQDGCRSMNDFIEKAVNFYIGYLEAGDKNTYLPKVLRSVIDGSIGKFEDRMSHLMFKQSVETDMMATLTAHDHELSEETMRRLRANSVRNARRQRGACPSKITCENRMICSMTRLTNGKIGR